MATVQSDPPATQTMMGGGAIAQMLSAHGVGPMFGMGGFQLLPMYDAIRDLGLEHHLVNDERAGAFMADAYARVSGNVGVCDGTLGPGATNLVTGLIESLNAGIPVVALTGDTNRAHSWKNMTQEGRQTEILRPASKELIRVEDARRIPELMRRAFLVATSGRPGPVVVDVPEDVAHAWVDLDPTEFAPDHAYTSGAHRRVRPDQRAVREAAALLRRARRPLVLVGGGIHLSRAYPSLARFAETLSIPVAHTMSGKGALACTHPLSAGLFGRYSRVANELITESDCLIVAGCKLGEIATRRYDLVRGDSAIIQIDIEPEELGRTARVSVPIWADAASALDDILDELGADAAAISKANEDRPLDLAARVMKWRDEAAPKLESVDRPVHMARLISELNRVLPPGGILVADGGFAAHWSGLLFDTKTAGRTYIADRGFASIGYGLPGAIGAALARPEGPVVALTGDGGLNMSIGELETALRVGLGITVVVINNAASGYVKALQHAMFDGRYQSADLHGLDYATIARAFGCGGIRVEDPSELAGAIRVGIEDQGRPTVIDVFVTRDPAQMLPGVDNRTRAIRPGDRIA